MSEGHSSRRTILGCLGAILLVGGGLSAIVAGFFGVIALPWLPLPPDVGATYTMRPAVMRALADDAAGVQPRIALREIERLPVFGCADVEETADGGERCVQQFGAYMHRRHFRVRAYHVLAWTYLQWPNVDDRFGATQRPSPQLASLVARRLERDPSRAVIGASAVPESLRVASYVPLAAAIYHDLRDERGFDRAIRRHCGEFACDFAVALYRDDLDAAASAAEAFDFQGGNMGQRVVRTSYRLDMLKHAVERGRNDLALRLGRILMRDFDGYPIEASEALRVLFEIAPREEFLAWVREKDAAARQSLNVESASAAVIAITGWTLLGEIDRANAVRAVWAPVAVEENRQNCQLAGPATRIGEPPAEGDPPVCLAPYKEIIGFA
jgi:hypothetical protein